MMNEIWRDAILPPNSNIGEVVKNLDKVAIKIALIASESGLFVGTISDGDIRRALLKGLNLESPIDSLINRSPFVVPPNVGRDMVTRMMMLNKIQQIPIINDKHQIMGLHLWDNLATQPKRSNVMVIMAGGKGTRLYPYTQECPKPLVRIAGKPMLEHIIERAKLEGFNHFILAVHHLGHMIKDYFGDGSRLQCEIEYLDEKEPLGTAGALSLINFLPSTPLIVTNGDVITDIRYGDLLDFHALHNATATMAVRFHEWANPFGVVSTNGIEIIGFEEKPVNRSYINAGIYALQPSVLVKLMQNQHCDMPTLFEKIRSDGDRTIVYPMHEPWLDVGIPDDLIRAQKKLDKASK
ncbi:nucleotidyltransferase family protein [Polynucleobacter sphagniphilus]|uniref:nucleotidyltransferase family protein n=1 Tax=Polynucleobacter sphagniphilus TaxID=1743169 RepID=UPI002474CF6D|nr:nucleotidyltransferase family protein [Polynucleobacter sphagniphilus]MDH6525574.1 dTDP-glucose pyrophosphorylase [Polynucleobacter sphagniphilus]